VNYEKSGGDYLHISGISAALANVVSGNYFAAQFNSEKYALK
jgi:hypothetical protein